MVSKIIFYTLLVLIVLTILHYRKNIIAFAKASRQEMKKVIWPTVDKALHQVRAIVISLIVLACFFGFVDYALYKIMNFVF